MNPEAERAKREGNDCMKQNNFIQAMLHYSRAVKIDPYNATYYSNRSLALLKLEQYYHAWDDAKKAIELMPKWAKGYLRKGDAERLAQRYKEAITSYKLGLSIDPENNDLQSGLKLANEAFKQQKLVDKRIPMYGIIIGIFLGFFILFINEILVQHLLLKECWVKMLILITIISVSYGISCLYRSFLHAMSRYLLEPPPELQSDKSS